MNDTLYSASKPPADAGSPAASACAHCGDPLAGARVVQRRLGAQSLSFCCLGCAFIAEQMALAQAALRDVTALHGPAPAAGASVTAPSTGAEAGADAGADSGTARHVQTVDLVVDGMVCAACALLIEHRLTRQPGVLRVDVDFAARRARCAIDPQVAGAETLRTAIARCGYRAWASREAGADAACERRAGRIELARVLLAWLAMMQVMMLALPAYVTSPGDVPADLEQLLRIAQLVLTAPVLLFSAAPLFRAAWSQWRARFVGMDLPIALGLAAAAAASVHATVTAHGPVYFDSITMFVAFVLGSRWLQARALARTRARVDAAEAAARLDAQRLRAWPASLATDTVPAAALHPGDRVLVPAGEIVPADARVLDGASTVSLAWLTGESTPVPVAGGQRVLAGSVNVEQALVAEVLLAGETTSLAALRRLADEAARERPPIVETGHRVAVAFLWIVLGITVATLAGWWLVDPAQAVPSALAVLVATCPCALSLAAPAAFSAAQARLARDGVQTARLAAVERLAAVDVFASDKTGTLTAAMPVLERTIVVRGLDDGAAQAFALSVAASLESLSTHPFARALSQSAAAAGLLARTPLQGRVVAGSGVEGTIDGRRYRLGSRRFVFDHIAPARRSEAAADLARRLVAAGHDAGDDSGAADRSLALLADEDGVVAALGFSERLRDDAVAFAAALRATGTELHIVSGDGPVPVRRLCDRLGLDPATHAHAQQSPEDKRRFIASLQRGARRVAMLGDGMNDAPVLAQADVSFALGTELGGTALAQARADFVVTSNRLAAVAAALVTARAGMRIVRQNFRWAFAYNVVAIPLAAFGYLTPALAAAGMAASSLLVVANALRLLREPSRG
jgi:Cu2+-exporting ATPase